MAGVGDRIQQAVDEDASSWGIAPIPSEQRRLSGFDVGILWGDLSIGLLVMLTGAFLVPALGLPAAVGAIVVGTTLGCIALALAGLAGQRAGVPGMALFRPVLGVRGSYLPSVLNIAQLIGWTGFEFWVMSLVASQMSDRLLGFSSYWLWLAVVALVCTALALGGPVIVVRLWLERFGAWVLIGVAAWISVRLVTTSELGALWRQPGTGGLGFWLAVDLAIALPVSWLPLVADYNRYARSGRSSAVGTFVGYAVGNVWFYALGALLVLGARVPELTPAGVGDALAELAGGAVVLLALLVGETDEAFADVYSAAVSARNLNPRIAQRPAVLLVALAGVGLAAVLGLRPDIAFDTYESFLFLLGSVFVPLFGVFLADAFVLRRGRGEPRPGFRPPALAAWTAGFLVYQWCVPTGPAWWKDGVQTVLGDGLGLPVPLWDSIAGASIPSFGAAFGVHLLFGALTRRPSR